MIVRILDEGQFRVDDSAATELSGLDAVLDKAVTEGDEAAFRSALSGLIERVRALGTPLPADALEPSDLILPRAGAGLDEVRTMMTDEGSIPG